MRADLAFWKSEWIDFLKENKDDCEMICYQTLKNFDNLVPRLLENSGGILVNNGPLNEYAQQDAFLYISAPNAFFDQYFIRNKIRGGRQTAVHNATGLNRYFKGFFVIKKSSTNDYIPTVKLYRKKCSLQMKLKSAAAHLAVNLGLKKSQFLIVTRLELNMMLAFIQYSTNKSPT